MTYGIGLVFFPTSWHFDFWPRAKKDILAIGPFRFVFYKTIGEWTP